MHRDVKLGLALGILIIGFAGAFCFPRQASEFMAPVPQTGPKLALVDDEIRQLRVRSFVGDEIDRPVAELTSAAPWSGELTDADAVAALQRRPTTAPQPIPPGGVAAPVNPASAPSAAEIEPATRRASTYTVQSGDTLSGIAARFLGSPKKFPLLYEANREVLRTPDDLAPGMVLLVPGDLPSPPAVASAARTPEETSPNGPLSPAVSRTSASPTVDAPLRIAGNPDEARLDAEPNSTPTALRFGRYRPPAPQPMRLQPTGTGDSVD